MVESTETTEQVPDAPVTAEERHEAVRLITRLLAAILAVVVAAGVATLLTNDDDGDGFGGEVTLINAIGPLAGRDLTAYVADRRNDMAKVRGPRAAVVSLATYMKEADARRLFDGMTVSGLLVAAPGGRPTLVRGDLAAWAEKTRSEAVEERKQFEALLPTYDAETEADFVETARTEIGRLTRLEQAAAPDGEVVFAVVVVGDVNDLQRIASTTGVRLVDVGASARVPESRRIPWVAARGDRDGG